VFLLEAWFELNALMREPIQEPKLAPTWVELHPGVLDAASGSTGLARADEWLALAELLATHTRASLSAFGFPEQDVITLRSVVDVAEAVGGRSYTNRDLAESLVKRIWKLVPKYAVSAQAILALRSWAQSSSEQAERWWTPEHIPAPPTTELTSTQRDFDRDDVASVLADL
jgi:hypothetical protein